MIFVFCIPFPETFNTSVDIKLRLWTEQELPTQSVSSGWQTLKSEFMNFLKKASEAPNHDDIFDQLKEAVVNEAMKRHSWEDKASEMLRVIQLNTLEDRTISDKRDWDQAVKFLESSIKEKLKDSEQVCTVVRSEISTCLICFFFKELKQLLGPGTKERWLYWRSQTETQAKRNNVKGELDRLLYSNEVSLTFNKLFLPLVK